MALFEFLDLDVEVKGVGFTVVLQGNVAFKRPVLNRSLV